MLSIEKISFQIVILACAICLSISPFFYYFTSHAGNKLSLALSAIFLFSCAFKKVNLSKNLSWLYILLISLILGFVNSFYWGSPTIVSSIYFISALFLWPFLDHNQIIKFVTLMSFLHFWMLVLSIFGLIYTFYNHDPLMYLNNLDGRANGLYLTTLSNANISGFIRPSGIYDEPGTFSFIICLLVALREALSLDRRLTRKILVLGCVTVSVAHLIFLLVYFLLIDKKRLIFVVVFVFSGFAASLYIFNDVVAVLNEVFFNRFTFVDGRFLGDNRLQYFFNAFSYLNSEVFIFGMDSDCIVRNSLCDISKYDSYGDNPLSLIIHYGLTLTWAYYFLLFYLMYRSFRGDFMSFGVFLLLLLKPYLYSFGFAIMLVIYTYVLVNQSDLFAKKHTALSNHKTQA